jgi:hypothetical protein
MDAERAEEALGVLRSGRDRVLRETSREELLTLATRSVGTVVWLGLRDVRNPVARRSAKAALFAGLIGFAVWRVRRMKVTGVFSARQQRLLTDAAERRAELEALPWQEQFRTAFATFTPEQKASMALAAAMSVSRHLVVRGFRQSSVRHPHLAAGLVVGVAEATIGLLQLRRKRASDDG